MTKTVFFIAILVTLMLASCQKKVHTCFCSTVFKSGTLAGTESYHQFKMAEQRYFEARRSCEAMADSVYDTGGKTRCSLLKQ